LHNNGTPSKRQRRWMKTIINSDKQDIASLDDEIEGLRSSIDRLLRRRDKYLSRIQACEEALQSHIRNLPVELLSEIFLFCIASPEPPNALPTPVLLSQVCALWRNILLNSPRFW
ncbi:hypothetical protein FISHEDRAFT_10653, partial [Fistulina hepatica ATCC 64428]